MKIARIYQRVSTEIQCLARQDALIAEAKAQGYYVAGVYSEKISGAIEDKPELNRLIQDLQPNDVVIAESIDRLTRLPLNKAELLVQSIKSKGAKISVPNIIDLSELINDSDGVVKIVIEAIQDIVLKIALQSAHEDYINRRMRQKAGILIAKEKGKYRGRKPDISNHKKIIELRKIHSITKTAELIGCSVSQVKRISALEKKVFVISD
jgi:DNA invertase Pin-like site-specific DNA recombinase